MRRSILSLGPVSLCILAAFACDDADLSGGSDLDLDGGRFDAFVPPAPGLDGGAEASVPQAVTVTVLGSPAARADIEIVFGDASGAVVTTQRTDANGRASGPVDARTVTALLRADGRYSLVTWTGVESGEALAVRGVEPAGNASLVGAYNVGFTVTDAVRQVRRVDVEASALCTAIGDDLTAPVRLDVNAPCVFGATSALLAEGRFEGSQNFIRYFGFKKGLALPAASTDVTIDNWVLSQKVRLTAGGFPTDSYLYARFFEIANGAPFHRQGTALDTELGTVDFDVAPGFADALQASVAVNGNDPSHSVAIVRAPDAAGLRFDLGSPLPAIAGAETTGDRLRRTFTWTGDTSATAGGAVQTDFTGTVANARYTWTIFVPPGTTTVTAPALPADAAAFAPDPEAAPAATPSIAFVAGEGLTPAVLRAAAFASLDVGNDGLETTFTQTPMPTNGTYRLTAFELRPR